MYLAFLLAFWSVVQVSDEETWSYLSRGYRVFYPQVTAAKQLVVTLRSGSHAYRLLVDTGACQTHLDTVRSFGTGVKWEKIGSPFPSDLIGPQPLSVEGRLSNARLGLVALGDVTVYSISMEYINKSLAVNGLPEVDGVLGMDVLGDYGAVVNLEKGLIFLRSERSNLSGRRRPSVQPAGAKVVGSSGKKGQQKYASRVTELFGSIADVTAGRRADILEELEAEPGEQATFAIASLLPLLKPTAEDARRMLVRRLEQVTSDGLGEFLRDADAPRELRLAAVRAAGDRWSSLNRPELELLVRRLTHVLGEQNSELAREAATSLRRLTGKDFGINKSKWLAWMELEWEK